MDAQPSTNCSVRCPACSVASPQWLESTSKLADVNYYRCQGCGHVWTTNRDNGAILHHVTPLTRGSRLPAPGSGRAVSEF